MLRNSHLLLRAENWWDLRLHRQSWNSSVNRISCPSEPLFSYGWYECCLHHSCRTPLSCWTPFWKQCIGCFAGWDETWLPWARARHSWTTQQRGTSGKLAWSQLGTWEERCLVKACAYHTDGTLTRLIILPLILFVVKPMGVCWTKVWVE